MIRTLLKEVKEYKAASIATPIFMILEVLFETLIPFLMASIAWGVEWLLIFSNV